MNWELDKSRPICPQLCELICVAVAKGEYSAGEKLLSVREVALQAGVNPNTVQKTFEELERKGVVHSVRCMGWYVNDDIQTAVNEVESYRIKKTEEYLYEMAQLGCTTDDVLKYLNKIKEGKDE